MKLIHTLRTTTPYNGFYRFNGGYQVIIDYTLIDDAITINNIEITPDGSKIQYNVSNEIHPVVAEHYRAELIAQAEADIQRQREYLMQEQHS